MQSDQTSYGHRSNSKLLITRCIFFPLYYRILREHSRWEERSLGNLHDRKYRIQRSS